MSQKQLKKPTKLITQISGHMASERAEKPKSKNYVYESEVSELSESYGEMNMNFNQGGRATDSKNRSSRKPTIGDMKITSRLHVMDVSRGQKVGAISAMASHRRHSKSNNAASSKKNRGILELKVTSTPTVYNMKVKPDSVRFAKDRKGRSRSVGKIRKISNDAPNLNSEWSVGHRFGANKSDKPSKNEPYFKLTPNKVVMKPVPGSLRVHGRGNVSHQSRKGRMSG